MSATPLRRTAHLIMAASFRIAPAIEDDWVTAMATELDYIPSDWAAVEFSIGCFLASLKENVRMEKYEPVMRWFLASCILCWAIAKIYLLVAFSGFENAGASVGAGFNAPGWLLLILSGAALAYGSSAYFLFKKHFIRFGLALTLALAVNAAALSINVLQYAITGVQNTENLSFYLALISEDYFIWTAILFGIAVIWVTKNSNHVLQLMARP